MSNYLVTGAAGFIGGAVARRLLDLGHKVTTIDNLSTGNRENIPDGVLFIEGGCHDVSLIQRLHESRFDGVIHIAGQSSGAVSFENPIYDLQTNTQSTLLLLDLCVKTGCKKFVYASTMSVYGDQPDAPVSETATCKPLSFYGVGKLASEKYLHIYEKFGINCTALRLFNVYGPGQNMQNMNQGMVSIFLAQAMKGGVIHIKGSLERFRDFVYIDDVVDAFQKSLDKPKNNSLIVNIGTGRRTTVGLLARMIGEIIPGISVFVSGNTPGDQFGIYADVRHSYDQIGFVSKVSLLDGLERTVRYLRDHNI